KRSGGGAEGPDRLFFAGTRVLTGQGLGQVSRTGPRSRLGAIARLASQGLESPSPLQEKIAALTRRLVLAAVLLVAALFLVSLATGAGPAAAFLSAVSLGMAAIPEEFSLVLAVFLSLGAFRLSRRGVLVKRLAAVETLGSTTVICLDKTGTLTEGRFTLGPPVPLAPGVDGRGLLEAALWACEASPADPMEQAILEAARRSGTDPDRLQGGWRLVHDYDLDPVGKRMAHVWRRAGGEDVRVAAKGSLEGILAVCELAPGERERAESENARLAGGGGRVLAVAGREGGDCTGDRSRDERGLRLYGLLAFRDPLRPDVPGAVRACQGAGVKLKLVTGDHPLTARAVADAAGIAEGSGGPWTGTDLAQWGPEETARRVGSGAVFARVQPEQKVAIVEALRGAGEVVAMTGDGVNDAPALRRAHIGVAMGRRGTQAARDAADLVLLEDRFPALVEAVREGRRVFDNIRSSFLYLIAFKAPVFILAFLCPLFGFPLLLLPVHLVWFEMIVHPVSALVFEGQEAAPGILSRPPRPARDPLLPPAQVIRALLSGLFLALLVLAIYLKHLDQGVLYARSTALATQVLGSLLLLWAGRAEEGRGWRALFPAQVRFWAVVGAAALSLPLIFQVRGMAALFQVQPIQFHDWALAMGLALLAVGWRFSGLFFPVGPGKGPGKP
ncbi:MAG TPA: HAD-IC family P-type ATPase, partial [bacterium]|nr:HAD-IC family P-type ATPase [bacterium]